MEKISEILFVAIVSLVSLSIIASGTPDFMSNEARAKELGIGSLRNREAIQSQVPALRNLLQYLRTQ